VKAYYLCALNKGEKVTMKKIFSIAFCVLLLCSLLLMVNVGSVLATEAGYSITEAYGGTGITLDGKWGGTNGSEWISITSWLEKKFPTAANARFGYQMVMDCRIP
jgi:hypothetical protein